MRVVLSPRAQDDLREIQIYIAFDNIAAATKVASRIRAAIEILPDHPMIGTIYEDGEARRLVVPHVPYCVYYDLDEPSDTISVLTIAPTGSQTVGARAAG